MSRGFPTHLKKSSPPQYKQVLIFHTNGKQEKPGIKFPKKKKPFSQYVFIFYQLLMRHPSMWSEFHHLPLLCLYQPVASANEQWGRGVQRRSKEQETWLKRRR